MTNKKIDFSTCLYFSSNSLSRIMTKIADEEFAITGLTSSYAFLIMAVLDNPGIQPKTLSEQMLLSPSTITRLIEKMELRKLLKRKSVGRSTEVYPTKTGVNLKPSIVKAWESLRKRYSEIMGEEQAKSLTTAIHLSTQILSDKV